MTVLVRTADDRKRPKEFKSDAGTMLLVLTHDKK